MMAIEAKHIEAALRSVGGLGNQGWSLEEIASGANDALLQSGITTKEGAAVFIAQCMVESAYFRTTTEYAYKQGTSGWVNMQRYFPYIGRGFLQITWESNYRNFGKWCYDKGLVNDPDYFMSPNETRLSDPKWAWLGAVWFFTSNNLVDLANAGENVKVGRAVNRGNAYSNLPAYGEAHRVAAYDALLKAGITAPSKPIEKEDWLDMASEQDVQNSVEKSWSKSFRVPGEDNNKTRNQMLNWAYSRSGRAARDAAAALAIVRELAKAQGLTDEQLDEIERKIDALAEE